jgi:hypothetical protein
MFTFGLKDGCSWTEWISTDRLTDWLQSPKKSSELNFEETLALIFVQICLALKFADNEIGFRHGDLVHRNVMIQVLEEEKSFDYPNGDSFHRIYTSVIPVLIDYEKSDVCYFDKESVCVLPLLAESRYKDETYDVVSLILCLFEKNLNKGINVFPEKIATLLIKFAAKCLEEDRFNLDSIEGKRMFVSHYTERSVRERKRHVGKVYFLLDELLMAFPNMKKKVQLLQSEPICLRMAEESPLLIYHASHIGNDKRRLATAVLYSLQEKRIPVFTSEWQMDVQKEMSEHQFQILYHLFEEFPDLMEAYKKLTSWRNDLRVSRRVTNTLNFPMLAQKINSTFTPQKEEDLKE